MKIFMIDYTVSMTKQLIERVNGKASALAVAYLFLVRVEPNVIKLNVEARNQFHSHVVILMLFLQYGHSGICMTTDFSSTQASFTDKDDHKKLIHVIKYIQGKPDIDLEC